MTSGCMRRWTLGGPFWAGVSILLMTLLLASWTRATTTVCAGPWTPCEKYAQSPRIFVGTVSSVVQEVTTTGWRMWRSRFVVTKLYKGLPMDSVELQSSDYYRVGESYLVYADSLLRTSWCSGTEKYDEHSVNLRFLEGLPGSLSMRSIWGTVVRETTYFDLQAKTAPCSGLTVRSESATRTFETKTDQYGLYVFNDLPADSYTVAVDPPAGFVDTWYWCPHNVELATKMCDVVDMVLIPDGVITGTVMDSLGRPFPSILVEVHPVDPVKDPNEYSNGLMGRTDEHGEYCIRGIPPGVYHVGSNLTDPPSGNQPYDSVYFPGVRSASLAIPVELGLGQRREAVNFAIERTYPVVLVKGMARYTNGQIPRSAHVALLEAPNGSIGVRNRSYANTDTLGRFVLPVLASEPGWALCYASMHLDAFMKGYEAEPPVPVFIDPAAVKGEVVLTIGFKKK